MKNKFSRSEHSARSPKNSTFRKNFTAGFMLSILVISSVCRAEDNTKSFAGLNFGVGISYTHDLGGNDRITQARVVNETVRVEGTSNSIARVMLESHYFFAPQGRFLGMAGLENGDKKANWGAGPFVALQPGSENIIEAIGLGLMVGFKRNDDVKDKSSFNIGVGVVVDPSVRILGSGLKANQPLPPGEEDVRYRTKSQAGLLVLTSFSFF